MKVTVYFDYLCPYCYKGVMDLLDLMETYPQLEIDWNPLEAHPRPEICAVYSDTASAAMYSVREHGGDLKAFNRALFTALYKENLQADDMEALAEIAGSCGADRGTVLKDLREKTYIGTVENCNDLVWEKKMYEAVPDYIAGEKELLSRGGRMIPKEELKSFLESLI